MRFVWLVFSMIMVCVAFFAMLFINVVAHEEGHVAVCVDLKGVPSTAYSLGGLAGMTKCGGLSTEDLKLANALAAVHEVYTYQIGVVLAAVFISTMIIVFTIYIGGKT